MDTLSQEERSRLMSRIKSRDTGPERRVRKRLHALGFRFRLYRRDLPGTPDIVLPRYRTVVMVHGYLWHGHRFCACRGRPKSNIEYWREKIRCNRERDRRKARELRKLGWKVIAVWECETKIEGCIDWKLAPLAIRSVVLPSLRLIGASVSSLMAAFIIREQILASRYIRALGKALRKMISRRYDIISVYRSILRIKDRY